jgi:superfamily I DNA/RNA helicase
MNPTDIARLEFLRHTLATIAYRGGKVLRDAPTGFSTLRIASTSRTPGEILAHLCDLLDWAGYLCEGRHVWKDSQPQEWKENVARFFQALARLDERFSSGRQLGSPAEALFQGPFADALTHIGQIALLRRVAGVPIRGENYFRADIHAGSVGPAQSSPQVEFD